MSAVTQQQQQHTTSNGTGHVSGSQEPKQVLTQEVGWLFAKEYYKFMNSDPEMLHEFYGKKSISICGVEGEPVPQAKGQQEIRNMISSNEFKGRKVLVTNVDALPAISGSIMVQVIGQMDTKDCEGYLRFVHTFLLAEQQGGYYIHNDILRYLNEDSEDRETTAVSEADPASAAAVPADAAPVENIKKDEKVDADDDLKLSAETAQAAVAAETTEPAAAVEAAAPAAEVKAAVAEALAENIVSEVVADVPKAETKPEAKPEPKPKTKAPKEKPAAAAAPADSAPKAEQKPAAPPKPTTWANLAANNTNKWNDSTIAKVDGTVAHAPATHASSGASSGAAAATSDPSSRVSTPAAGARESFRGIKNEALSVFIKNVPSGTPIMTIKNAFKKFGPVGYVDYATHKTTGVVEFSTEEGKQAALRAASINIGTNSVVIEQRRPRPQATGRRDGGAAKQQGSGTPSRNGSGDFERVGSSRGSRGRAPTASSANAGANANGARPRVAKQ